MTEFFFSTGKPAAVDVVVVFGANGMNARRTFNKEKDFVEKLVTESDISQTETLFGAIYYDRDARMVLKIGDAISKQTTINRMQQIQRSQSGNSLRKGLELALEDSFSTENGARIGAMKTLVVFTDKTEARNQRLDDVASGLKQFGGKVVLVAIGPEVRKKDVAGIASEPKLFLQTDDLANEKDIFRTVAAAIRHGNYFKSSKGTFFYHD